MNVPNQAASPTRSTANKTVGKTTPDSISHSLFLPGLPCFGALCYLIKFKQPCKLEFSNSKPQAAFWASVWEEKKIIKFELEKLLLAKQNCVQEEQKQPFSDPPPGVFDDTRPRLNFGLCFTGRSTGPITVGGELTKTCLRPGPGGSWGLANTPESRFGGCFLLLLHV